MVFEFKLPDIGEGLHEGEIVKWLVNEGDAVKEGQPIAEVMTDKATVEIPAPRTGTIEAPVPPGTVVKVGQTFVKIRESGSGGGAPSKAAPAGAHHAPAAPAPVPAKPSHAPAHAAPEAPKKEEKEEKTLFDLPTSFGMTKRRPATPAQPQHAPVPTPAPSAPTASHAAPPPTNGASSGRVLAAPAVRRRAREQGIDLHTVRGSGPGGRVTREDFESFVASGGARQAPQQVAMHEGPRPTHAAPTHAPQPMAAHGSEERIPVKGLRKRIVEKMHVSKTTAAHFTYVEECDVTDLVKLREDAKEVAKARGVSLNYLPFVIRALIPALKKYPWVNASLDDAKHEVVVKHYYNIGLAAQTPEGLSVVVVKDADRKSILTLGKEIEELAGRAKDGKSKVEDVTGGTFTITSPGKFGGLLATPIINYPEVAILGVHNIKERPVVKDGQIVIRHMMNLSVSFDHRVVDGLVGAQFLHEVIKYLEDPKLLLLESV